jgi:hypothetical protein
MSGFFQNLGLQAGYNIIYGQQQARAQADTELKQQQVLAAKAQLAQQAQLADVRSKVSQVAQAELAGIKDDVEAPVQKADFAMKAAERLEAAGDLQGAASWRQQAEVYTKQGKEAREAAVQKQVKTTEDLAQAALAFKTAPSAETYGQLSAAIARSGGDISKMPLPGDPALPAFVEAQTRKGMKASDQLKLLAMEKEKELQRKQAADFHRENEAIRLEIARNNAALRREGLELHKMTLGLLPGSRPASSESIQDQIAMYRKGIPRAQIVPGHSIVAQQQWNDITRGAFAQIMEENPTLTRNEAAQLLAAGQQGFKATSNALGQVTKDLASIRPYKDMLDQNADIAISLSKQAIKSNSALANKPINWVRQNMADNPDTSEYLAQIAIVQTEAARVLSNPRLVGQLTDSARHEMQELVNGNMPLESTERVLKRIKQDGTNRIAAMEREQKALLKGESITSPTTAPTSSTLPAGWH